MTKKLLVLLAVLALVVAACGVSDDGTGATTLAPETTAAPSTETTLAVVDTTAAPPVAVDIALRWMTRPDTPEETAVYGDISEQLTTSIDGVTLTYEAGPGDTAEYQQSLLAKLAAGTAPDVFWIPGTDIAEFATSGVILDMRRYADASDHGDGDFYPGPMGQLTTEIETGQPGNALWGLPSDVSTLALYINLDLIEEAGVENPLDLDAAGDWNLENFNAVVDGIAALGGEIKGYGQDVGWGSYGAWLNAAGGGFFTDDRTACGLGSDASIGGLTALRDLYSGTSVVAYGEDPEPSFRAGSVGVFQDGRWATPDIRTVDFNWDVVGLPTGADGPGNWLFWGAYVVNADTKNPEAAWQLIEALTQVDVQGQLSALGANIPSRVSPDAFDVFLTATPPANNQAFLDGLSQNPTAEGPLWAGSWPEFLFVMDSEIQAVVTGDRDIEDFQDNICSETAVGFGG